MFLVDKVAHVYCKLTCCRIFTVKAFGLDVLNTARFLIVKHFQYKEYEYEYENKVEKG